MRSIAALLIALLLLAACTASTAQSQPAGAWHLVVADGGGDGLECDNRPA